MKLFESFHRERQTRKNQNNTGKGGHHEKELRFQQRCQESICEETQKDDLHQHQRIGHCLFQGSLRKDRYSLPGADQHVPYASKNRKNGTQIHSKVPQKASRLTTGILANLPR